MIWVYTNAAPAFYFLINVKIYWISMGLKETNIKSYIVLLTAKVFSINIMTKPGKEKEKSH